MNANKPPSKETLFELVLAGADEFNTYRRNTEYGILDLSGLDFTAKDMTGINLSNANLAGCVFDYATLNDAKFVMAEMSRCSCRETDFYMASFDEAEMHHSDLGLANFSGASFVEAVLTGCNANGAKFVDADLTDCKFNKAQLNDTDFTGANVAGTDFSGSEMEFSILDDVRKDARTRWGNNAPSSLTGIAKVVPEERDSL